MARRSKTRAEIELRRERLHHRYHLADATVPWLGRASLVAASWIPLQAIQPMIASLAGKSTTVDAVASVTATTSLIVSGGWYLERRKNRKQANELARLRGRTEQLEELPLRQLTTGEEKGDRP